MADENLNNEPEVSSDELLDKTEENEDTLGFPDEDESLEDKKEEKKSSEIVQKIKYREKTKKQATRIEELENEIERTKKAMQKAPEGSEQERAAKDYITKLVEEVYESKRSQEKRENEKELQRFEDKVEAVLDDNHDIPEAELLEIIEELEVEPEIAAKVWKRQSAKPLKPKLPNPKRAIAQSNKMEYTKEDKGKSMFQLGREAIEDAKKKGWL